TNGQIGVPIQVTINPTGLTTGAYYGTIQVAAANVLNSPQSVTVVLHVAAAGTPIGATLDNSGLVFVASQGGSDPPPQTIAIANPTGGDLKYTSQFGYFNATNASPSIFTATPRSATIASGQTQPLTIQAALTTPSIDGSVAKVAAVPGTYTAALKLNF